MLSHKSCSAGQVEFSRSHLLATVAKIAKETNERRRTEDQNPTAELVRL